MDPTRPLHTTRPYTPHCSLARPHARPPALGGPPSIPHARAANLCLDVRATPSPAPTPRSRPIPFSPTPRPAACPWRDGPPPARGAPGGRTHARIRGSTGEIRWRVRARTARTPGPWYMASYQRVGRRGSIQRRGWRRSGGRTVPRWHSHRRRLPPPATARDCADRRHCRRRRCRRHRHRRDGPHTRRGVRRQRTAKPCQQWLRGHLYARTRASAMRKAPPPPALLTARKRNKRRSS